MQGLNESLYLVTEAIGESSHGHCQVNSLPDALIRGNLLDVRRWLGNVRRELSET